jgi:hypothetical protein
MTTPLTGVVGTLPLSNTTVAPIPGELVQAAHVQVPVQALLDQDATLEEFAVIDLLGRPGGNTRVVQFNIGITVFDGVLTDAVVAPATGPAKVKINQTNAGEIEAVGPVTLTGAAPAPTADPGADNRLQTGNLVLAHGKVDFNAGVVTINGGYNVASASISISVQANIVFVRAMADAHYTVVLGCRRGAAPGVIEYPLLLSQSTTGFSCNIRDLAAGAAPVNLSTQHPGELYFTVTGSQ